ncbi:MAG TPA: anaerobic ribonucleoside-triphosphate reductase activating protein [Desulfobacteraceae bacterium]|nr:anaerobic ribonucleoside-triphosphate reductase activating protein [Desulfobacteraceae bacterium]
MIIGGIQKNSFIDYPDKISCVLFLAGCNFHCPYCHNPDLARGIPVYGPLLDEKSICKFLERRRDFLDGVVISGGEPTLQKELLPLCEKIKNMGYHLKLDSNGSRPKVVQKLINEKLVDYIAMDIKSDPYQYASLIKKGENPDSILSTIQIIMESSVKYEFRTTCVKPFVNEEVVRRISRIIKGSMLYVLQQFHYTHILEPDFFQNNNYCYNDDELIRLQSIAKQWVKECVCRL